MTLLTDFQQGIISKRSYIRLTLTTPRLTLGNNFPISLPIAGIEDADTITEASNLIFSEFIGVTLPTSIEVVWDAPELLPGYTPDQVLDMRVAGQGFLYFALGAENPTKAKTQTIAVSRLKTFYRMTEAAVLQQLGLLLQAKVCTSNLATLNITWLNKQVDSASTSVSIAAHEASTNHPVATETTKGLVSPEMVARINTALRATDLNLGSLATKSTIVDADIAANAAIASSKISGLGSLAALSSVSDANISSISLGKITGLGGLASKSSVGDAEVSAISQNKISGLTTTLGTKQDLIGSSSNLIVANLTTTKNFISTTTAQNITAAGTITPNQELVQITAATAIEMTAAVPITAGAEGQRLNIINVGTTSIYIKALALSLRPRTSTSLIYLGTSWVITSAPANAAILGRNQEFKFINDARVFVNDDSTFTLFNATGTQLSQETGIPGLKVDFNRGILAPDNNTWNRPAGHYRYILNTTGVTLPATLSNLIEYRCF